MGGVPHGRGEHVWTDGRRYEGEWMNGKASGYGTYRWPDGQRYEGEWRNDERNGHGVQTRANGTRYEGGVPKRTLSWPRNPDLSKWRSILRPMG